MSIPLSIISILAPVILWVIANWCITTLFEGEGSFKDVFIAASYSLTPFLILIVPVTIASNFVIGAETDMLTLLMTVSFIWMALLLILGMMVTHDYMIGKNFLTVLGTILGMVCIMFIVLLFSFLFGKLVGFVTNIIDEISFRV